MKLRKHHLGALTALVALALAACGGGGTPGGFAVPSGTPPAAPAGPLALIGSGQAVALTSTNGTSGVVTIPAGTGTVNVASSASPPTGTVALQSAVRNGVVTASLKPLATGPDTALLYVAITASGTATLNGVPGMTLTFASPPTGSVFEALLNGAQWITVGSAGTVSGSTVTLAGSSTTQTVTPGTPLFLVAYVGVTQSGVQSNVIVDGGFETEGAASAFAGATSGWAACSYTHPNTEATSPPATPNPQITGKITAVLVSANSPAFTVGATPKPTATPVVTPAPTVTPAVNTGSFAALTYTGTGADTTYGKSTNGANGVCQTFVVPASGVLSLAVKEGGDESGITFGDQEATLFKGGLTALAGAAPPSPIPVFAELNATVPTSTSSPAAYVKKGPFALTLAPPMGLGLSVGTTVTLFVGTYDNGSSNTFGEYMLVDDVSVLGFLPQP
jgi:hypothetical protein